MNERLSAASGKQCLNTEVGIEYWETITPLKYFGDVSDRFMFLWYFCAGRGEELISLKQLLPVKVPVAAPGRTRNALCVDNEWKSHSGSLATSQPLQRVELVPRPTKTVPGSAMPRRVHSHRSPVPHHRLRRTPLETSAADERRFFSSHALRSFYECPSHNAA